MPLHGDLHLPLAQAVGQRHQGQAHGHVAAPGQAQPLLLGGQAAVEAQAVVLVGEGGLYRVHLKGLDTGGPQADVAVNHRLAAGAGEGGLGGDGAFQGKTFGGERLQLQVLEAEAALGLLRGNPGLEAHLPLVDLERGRFHLEARRQHDLQGGVIPGLDVVQIKHGFLHRNRVPGQVGAAPHLDVGASPGAAGLEVEIPDLAGAVSPHISLGKDPHRGFHP